MMLLDIGAQIPLHCFTVKIFGFIFPVILKNPAYMLEIFILIIPFTPINPVHGIHRTCPGAIPRLLANPPEIKFCVPVSKRLISEGNSILPISSAPDIFAK
ncbi:MAG: hypothetical protein WCJ45_03775 [bacterium]